MSKKFKHQTDAIRNNIDEIAKTPFSAVKKIPAEFHAVMDLLDQLDRRLTRIEEKIGKKADG